jgi:toluene monooxygenase system protein E
MNDAGVLQPLKTWSHLAGRRRKPSEYEIVSTNLLYNTRPGSAAPYELDPDMFMNVWYRTYRDGSGLQHPDWNAFRDPDELVYRTYTMLQDGQETYVFGLFDQFNERGHDQALDPAWVAELAHLYAPARYLFHTLQMASAYLQQMSPASTVTNCAAFQAADSLRWLSHTAYRTKELSVSYPDLGFGTGERAQWETAPAWQGFRELMERVLTTWDWSEAFVALNLVAKPAVEEAVLRRLGHVARHNGDTLLGMLTDAELIDADRHRRWASALVRMVIAEGSNAEVMEQMIAVWEPLADAAIDAFCGALPDALDAADVAKSATREFRRSLVQ